MKNIKKKIKEEELNLSGMRLTQSDIDIIINKIKKFKIKKLNFSGCTFESVEIFLKHDIEKINFTATSFKNSNIKIESKIENLILQQSEIINTSIYLNKTKKLQQLNLKYAEMKTDIEYDKNNKQTESSITGSNLIIINNQDKEDREEECIINSFLNLENFKIIKSNINIQNNKFKKINTNKLIVKDDSNVNIVNNEIGFNSEEDEFNNLKEMIFDENTKIKFNNNKIYNDTDFYNSTFPKETIFTNNKFGIFEKEEDKNREIILIFKNSKFKGNIDFSQCIFNVRRKDIQKNYSGMVDDIDVAYNDDIDFRNILVEGNFIFNDIRIINENIKINFENSNFNNAFYFKYKNKEYEKFIKNIKELNLRGCNFKKNVEIIQKYNCVPDLTNINHHNELTLSGIEVKITEPEKDKDRLRKLKAISEENNDIESALYFNSLEMSLREKNLLMFLYKLFSNYGRSISRPVSAWFLFNLIFAFVYYVFLLWNSVDKGFYPSGIINYCSTLKFSFMNRISFGQILRNPNKMFFEHFYNKPLNEFNLLIDMPWHHIFIIKFHILISAVLIFLVLLGVRNRFRIK